MNNSPGTVKLIIVGLLTLGVLSLLVGLTLSWRHLDAGVPFGLAGTMGGALAGLLAHTGSTPTPQVQTGVLGTVKVDE